MLYDSDNINKARKYSQGGDVENIINSFPHDDDGYIATKLCKQVTFLKLALTNKGV